MITYFVSLKLPTANRTKSTLASETAELSQTTAGSNTERNIYLR